MPRLFSVAQSRSINSFMSYVATEDNGRTANRMRETSLREFYYENSVNHVYDGWDLSKINNRTHLSATADPKSIAFLVLRHLYGNLALRNKERFYDPYTITLLTTIDYLRTLRSRETTVAM